MGTFSYSRRDWDVYSRSTVGRTTDELYATRADTAMDPRVFKGVRECRDSSVHPTTTPIIFAADTTGSMGSTADVLVRTLIGKLMGETISRGILEGPMLLPMTFGDICTGSASNSTPGDKNPLQVGQFEQDVETLTRWTKAFWLEKKGYANAFESIDGAMYFVSTRVVTDAWEKRGRKGYFFLATDDFRPEYLSRARAQLGLGVDIEEDIPFNDLLRALRAQWHVYVFVTSGESAYAFQLWNKEHPDITIAVSDVNAIPEIIVSIMEINEKGRTVADVASTWTSPSTAMAVSTSLSSNTALAAGASTGSNSGLIVKG